MRVISLVYRKGGFNYVFEKQKDSFHRIIDRVSFNMDEFSSKCVFVNQKVSHSLTKK